MINMLLVVNELKENNYSISDIINELINLNLDLQNRKLKKIKINIPGFKFISVYQNIESLIINYIKYKIGAKRDFNESQYYYDLYLKEILRIKRAVNLEELNTELIDEYNAFSEDERIPMTENSLDNLDNPNIEYNYKVSK